MAKRCPESRYLGLGCLQDWKWQINTRGYANIVPASGHSVQGLCYLLSKKDERSLDRSEGVPRAYEKRYLGVEVFSANALISGRRVREVDERVSWELESRWSREHGRSPGEYVKIRPEYHCDNGQVITALVYVNQFETSDGGPREEYRERIEAGMVDSIALGVPATYFDRYFSEAMAPRSEGLRDMIGAGLRTVTNFARHGRSTIPDTASPPYSAMGQDPPHSSDVVEPPYQVSDLHDNLPVAGADARHRQDQDRGENHRKDCEEGKPATKLELGGEILEIPIRNSSEADQRLKHDHAINVSNMEVENIVIDLHHGYHRNPQQA